MLRHAGDIKVAAECGDLPALLAAVEAHPPDVVVVTDVRMPPTGTDEGIRAATPLRGTHPRRPDPPRGVLMDIHLPRISA